MASRRVKRGATRISRRQLRDRLGEAEATLDAIRAGQVDAIVVSRPQGVETRIVEGAHPYLIMLDAIGDGAVLLSTDGAILFGNRSFEQIAGAALDSIRGSAIQQLVPAAERDAFDRFLRDGTREPTPREFHLAAPNKATTLVAISLSLLRVDASSSGGEFGDASTMVMGIITDLTFRNAADASRQRLIQQLISAEDDERRRVARELHDETGQTLAALLVGLRAIAGMKVRPEVRRAALRLRNVAAQTVDDVGRLARGLHPAVLDDMGLAAAARRHTADFVRSFATPIKFTAVRVDSPRLSSLVASTVYRILQESLTNVARYARAKQIVVSLRRDATSLTLSVSDDGVGFDVHSRNGQAEGLGLRGMMERVTLLGGSLEIESRPGHGTEVRARIPVRT